MQIPSTQHLLAAWERGRAAPQQVERALALLLAAHANMPRTAAAELPIGERDRRLLTLRDQMFGPRLSALTSCPECGAALELEFDARELGAAPEADGSSEGDRAPYAFRHDDFDLEFRLPSSSDVLSLPEVPEAENRMRLLERLVLRASRAGEPIPASALPSTVVDELERQLSRVDPQADIRLDLSCAACSARWQAPFDIVSYLWHEVDAWALRLLRDVHRLARAYSWREADILALSPSRRQCYLDLLNE
jgi:hypothetical protein